MAASILDLLNVPRELALEFLATLHGLNLRTKKRVMRRETTAACLPHGIPLATMSRSSMRLRFSLGATGPVSGNICFLSGFQRHGKRRISTTEPLRAAPRASTKNPDGVDRNDFICSWGNAKSPPGVGVTLTRTNLHALAAEGDSPAQDGVATRK